MTKTPSQHFTFHLLRAFDANTIFHSDDATSVIFVFRVVIIPYSDSTVARHTKI